MKTLLLLLALVCAFHPSPLCEAAVCYVKPTEPHNVTCPSEPCYTLDEYVSKSTRYFVSNTVFAFLSGYHNLSYNLAVVDVYNITLRPYIGKSTGDVVVQSEHMPLLMFKLSSDIDIEDMTFQALHINFENSTNVTLTGLMTINAFIRLNNVFGDVNIHFSCKNHSDLIDAPLKLTWNAPPPQHVTSTVVLLHELDLRLEYAIGVYISGCFPGKIVLVDSVFNASSSGIHFVFDLSCDEMLFICENTHFSYCLDGIIIIEDKTSHRAGLLMPLVLHNVSFFSNLHALNLDNVRNVTISDSYFGLSNYCGAITAANCVLTLMGNVTFRNNYNSLAGGGAISLDGSSQILIPEPQNSYILFDNNTSEFTGGAIYFSGSTVTGQGDCKIFIEQISNKIVFNFSMNSAASGGNAIYGAYIDRACYSPNGTSIQNISQLILNVSIFSPSLAADPSAISSDAQTLCICDEDGKQGDCTYDPPTSSYPSVYPGQVFTVPVAALGDLNGLVEWPVYAHVLQGEFGKGISKSQVTSAENCTYFQYSVLSKEDFAILRLHLTSSANSLCIQVYRVNFLDCPVGFSMSSTFECDCDLYLKEHIVTENLNCSITHHSIQRQGTTWIGVLESNTSSTTSVNTTTLVFNTVCPFHYCNRSNVEIIVNQSSFLNEDIQCTNNRSGVLCGGCRDSFSLALGSNRCLPGCSNSSLSLLIAFAAAGIALVFFIKILNLTVAQGTINGLIFYANIIGAEQSVLFFSRGYEGFLSVFIAWVNLDFGIETCFFDGMDAYAKAWLQYIFPVYVWAIALFIIISSHHSTRASKLFGNNSVPVLATLILLSYSKLLRTVISALSVTHLRFLNGSTMSVWERDGNIQYLTGKHIPLFVFAVAVLVLLWLPFTLILVSIQWLQRGTHYRVLRWVTKLRPFFDAFTGPLKDRHRYWVGVLLLARCLLQLFFYVYTSNGDAVAYVSITLAVLIILVFLAATSFIYRNYYLTVLELSYILNLGILATGTLYVQYINGNRNKEALVMTCVGIAFLQFLATVIYHACAQLIKFKFTVIVINQLKDLFNKLKARFLKMRGHKDEGNINGTEYEPLDESSFMEQPVLRPPSQDFRESLLAYMSD